MDTLTLSSGTRVEGGRDAVPPPGSEGGRGKVECGRMQGVSRRAAEEEGGSAEVRDLKFRPSRKWNTMPLRSASSVSGKVLKCEEVPKSKKLLCFRLDCGGKEIDSLRH